MLTATLSSQGNPDKAFEKPLENNGVMYSYIFMKTIWDLKIFLWLCVFLDRLFNFLLTELNCVFKLVLEPH